ncbi:uncharacterized protein J3R85_018484 [Psidium guajava]|nr:uncharacterized protein J3R85_018484 [Psidium guajava]
MGIERCEPSPCYLPLTEDELLVADILLELQWLFADRFPRGWGATRRRSALRGGSSSPSPAHPSPPPPPPPPPKFPPRPAIEDWVGPPKVHAASPDTPLSFSPSESDGNKAKQSHSKRKSTKRKREEWLKLIPLLEEQGDALRKEVENVRRYRDQVKALNSALKARKEELITRVIPGEAERGPEPSTRLTLGGEPAEPTAASLPSGSDRQVPSIPDQAESVPEKSEAGRLIPDLNIGLAPFEVTTLQEEWSSSSSSRARAAEARQRRKLIYKAKNPTVAVKPRVPLR